MGLLYFGTNHRPLIRASDAASRSTSSMSSRPSAVGSIGIISMPNFWQIEKCRSYPGTGHRNAGRSTSTQRDVPPGSAKSIACITRSCISERLELSLAISCSTGTCSSGLKISRSSGSPCSPP